MLDTYGRKKRVCKWGEREGASRSQRFPLTCAVSAYVSIVPYNGTGCQVGESTLAAFGLFQLFSCGK